MLVLLQPVLDSIAVAGHRCRGRTSCTDSCMCDGGRGEGEFGRVERHHHNEEDRDDDADQHAGNQVESHVRRRHLRVSVVEQRRCHDQRHRHQRSAPHTHRRVHKIAKSLLFKNVSRTRVPRMDRFLTIEVFSKTSGPSANSAGWRRFASSLPHLVYTNSPHV